MKKQSVSNDHGPATPDARSTAMATETLKPTAKAGADATQSDTVPATPDATGPAMAPEIPKPAAKARADKTQPDAVPAAPDARSTAMATETVKAAAKAGADGTQLVTFLLKDEEFGFDIMSVQEIIRLPKMSKLPHTPDYVEGISSLRGTVLPIFDIRTRFGMKREEHTDRSRVLVIDIEGKRTGLLVDGVRQVTRVGRNEFEPPPAAIRNETADYIDGVVKLDNGERIIIALDARRVCTLGSGNGDADAIAEALAKSSPHSSHEGQSKEAQSENNNKEAHAKGGEVRQLVSFQIGREEFAFPMEHVREILRVQTPKEVPGAPEHLLGVLTVRGQILPIVDLRRLLRQTSFAADLVAACCLASTEYQAWLLQSGTGENPDLHKVTAAAEQLRTWLSAFNSSSQSLTETLATARGLNEHVTKQASAAADQDLKGIEALNKDIVASAKAIVAALDTFGTQVEGSIHEDQRIIVVDSNGFQLGLVVDHVNEVLGVQDDAIEAPPNVAHEQGVSLSGIAKLDDGNRLILLLATGSLLDHKVLSKIAEDSAGEGTGAVIAAADETKPDDKKKEEETGQGEEVQLVTFLLGQEEYGIPIAKIQEIDRLSKITQTPKAPKFVEGVTNLRGEVIPVLSTRMLFALETKASDDHTRVIIVDLGGAKTGLVVDSVKQVLSISKRNIAPPPASISSGADGQFISGLGKVEDGKRMIVLLDVEKVLTRGEQSQVAALAVHA
jgi:chemotaxis signal transduction protein